MEKQQFNIAINAPREKVWNALWDDNNYRTWTAEFTEGSHVVTDNWQKDTKVLFLDSKGSGMVSSVTENIPNEYMAFKHLGEVRDGVEDLTSDRIKDWAGAMETYTLKDVNGKTELVIDMDINDEFKEYFAGTWPKALQKVKEIAEAN